MRQPVLNVLKKAKTKLVDLFGALIVVELFHNFLVAKNVLIIKNEGISFGHIFFGILILVLFLKEKSIGLLMITVGGFVNLSDRLRFGFVRDYWNLGGSGIYNNINDWIISLGVILFLIEIIWIKLKLK